MQTATSETESKSRDLSICVHHYTLRAPCPKGQGKESEMRAAHISKARVSDEIFLRQLSKWRHTGMCTQSWFKARTT